jgi:hypothetical protein
MSARILLSTIFIVLNSCTLQPSTGLADVWTSPNGKYVAFHAGRDPRVDETISVWDFRSGKELCRISHNTATTDRISAVAISESSGLVATTTNHYINPGVFVWDLNTGEMLWRDTDDESRWTKCRTMAFSADGKKIATLTNTAENVYAVIVRQSSDGVELRRFEIGESRGIYRPTVAFSPVGDSVFTYVDPPETYGNCSTIRCWDIASGEQLGDYQANSDPELSCEYGSFSIGSEFIVQEAEMYDKKLNRDRPLIVVWDAKHKTELRRIYTQPHGEFGRLVGERLALCEESDSVFIKLFDNELREYNLHTGEQISSFKIPNGFADSGDGSIVPVPQTSAIIWTCYLYDSTPGTRNVLGVSKYQPGEYKTITATFQALESRKDSAVILANTNRGVFTGNPEWVGTPGIDRVPDGRPSALRNHSSVKEIRSEPAAVKKLLADLSTPIPGRESKRIDRSKPRLFILGVGVSDHELDEKDLVYAASDARSLVEKFEAQHGSVYGDVQVKLYEDKQVTPDSVRDGLNWLAQSSTERDVVVLFFSGHGMRGRKGLYYFTHHGDEENLQNTCVNWSDVAKSLAATKASQILFLSDCCHAGAFSKDHFLNQADLARAIDSVENVAILASCTGEEGSLELDEFKHGAFTQGLLEALDGAGDLDGDGNSTWSEILDYVLVRVPKITGNEQHPIELKSAKSPKALILSTKKTAAGAAPPTTKAVVSP